MKVFFGCPMRGGHKAVSLNELRQLQSVIEELGHELTTKHQTQDGIFNAENQIAATQIHDRDYEWLTKSHVAIFEISDPSSGVGGEIADSVSLGRPVLCIFKSSIKPEVVSAYIRGKDGSRYISTPFKCVTYDSPEDAKSKIAEFIKVNT